VPGKVTKQIEERDGQSDSREIDCQHGEGTHMPTSCPTTW
jgi:hypothetical protein